MDMMNLNPANVFKRAGATVALLGHLAQGTVAAEAKGLATHRPMNVGEVASHVQPLKKDTLELAQTFNPNAGQFNQQGTTGQTGTVTAACQKAANIYNAINTEYTAALSEFQAKQQEVLALEAGIPQQRLQAIYTSTDAQEIQAALDEFYDQKLQGSRTQLESMQQANQTIATLAEEKYAGLKETCNEIIPSVTQPLQAPGGTTPAQ
jgi:hypothetical protein